jgi:hypothetical protein
VNHQVIRSQSNGWNALTPQSLVVLNLLLQLYWHCIEVLCRSQWPRVLRCRSVAAHLPRSWVRIPPGAWIFVCCECCVLSDRGLCDELITHPEEFYRLWYVVVCDLEISRMRRRPWPALGRRATAQRETLDIARDFQKIDDYSHHR